MTTFASITALLLGLAILVLGNGLQNILLPTRAAIEAFPVTVIGLVLSGYYLGFVLGCIYGPRVVRRVGHIRSYTAFAAVAAAAALGYTLVVDPYVWGALRCATGFCLAGLYMITESWLNERASNVNRGRILSTYRIVDLGGTTLGMMLLNLADPAQFQLFCIVSILISLSLVPVALTTAVAPTPIESVQLHLKQLFANSSLSVVGSFTVGLTNAAFWAMGPVYARSVGLPPSDIAGFMAAVVVGGAILQWPIGGLSDRFDRRTVLMASAFVAAAAGVALAAVGGYSVIAVYASGALFGGLAFTLYSLCIAHANDRAAPHEFVQISSGLLLVFGFGAVLGPSAGAIVMAEFGDRSLFAFTAAAHLLLGAYAAYRMRTNPAVPAEAQSDFVAAPRTSPAVFELDPRAEEDSGDIPEDDDRPAAA
ncbi:MAG: MFS transporter [Rhodospirillaceae bacterium]|nr:MFS transporter [Rhodospirillaceae bacterium]